MHIHIRIPRHPLAIREALMGLDALGVPRVVSRGTGSWVSMRVDNNKRALNQALEALVRINVLLMRAWRELGRPVPSIYDAAREGFRYVQEPQGREWWQTWLDNVATLEGDCEDIACHQAAYYRLNDLPASATTKRTGRTVYHAVVRHPGGAIEDPSLPLGLAEWRMRRALARTRKDLLHGAAPAP